ncbi:unnamed protein product [Cylicostephanus goldi]|uniref:Small RNA 2'-O-methyltransferase n=1 Tax=Cylicostephanus goldi TaxID=71465 RepID=A0A3P6SEF9_CYLGO|nr:unnamed protein product [Cylicostephanus goldi]
MTEEEAEKYVRSVLLTIKPQLFIISTPNHEYNEAFGLPTNTFRHNDHKFEFTRQGFRYWLYNIMKEFSSDYSYTVEYVGNISKFAHLQGATQFAVIRRKFSKSVLALPYSNTRPFKKVGEVIAKNSLYSLEREKVREAFKLWLSRNPLRENDLLKTFVGNYWRVGMSSVVDLINLPEPLKAKLNQKALVDMLRFLCNGRIVYETHHGEACLNIPHHVTKDELIGIMNSKNIGGPAPLGLCA